MKNKIIYFEHEEKIPTCFQINDYFRNSYKALVLKGEIVGFYKIGSAK